MAGTRSPATSRRPGPRPPRRRSDRSRGIPGTYRPPWRVARRTRCRIAAGSRRPGRSPDTRLRLRRRATRTTQRAQPADPGRARAASLASLRDRRPETGSARAGTRSDGVPRAGGRALRRGRSAAAGLCDFLIGAPVEDRPVGLEEPFLRVPSIAALLESQDGAVDKMSEVAEPRAGANVGWRVPCRVEHTTVVGRSGVALDAIGVPARGEGGKP